MKETLVPWKERIAEYKKQIEFWERMGNDTGKYMISFFEKRIHLLEQEYTKAQD